MVRGSAAVLGPALRVSRIVGVFPLGENLSRSKGGMATCFGVLVALVLALGFIVSQAVVRTSDHSEQHRLILTFKLSLLAMVPAVHLVRILSLGGELASVVTRIEKVEAVLAKAGVQGAFGSGSTFRYAWFRLIFELLYEVIRYFLSPIDLPERAIRIVYSIAGNVLAQLIQLQLYCFLQALAGLMDSLRRLLDRKYILKDYDILSVLVGQNSLELACGDLNRAYSLQTLFIVLYRYMSFLSSSFDVFMIATSYIKVSSTLINFVDVAMDISWLLYAIFDLIWLAHSCTSVIKTAEEVNKGLYELLLYSRHKDLLYSSKLKLHFVIGRKLEFSACGLFLLDYSLVHSTRQQEPIHRESNICGQGSNDEVRGSRRSMMDSYLGEFIWRKRFWLRHCLSWSS